MSGNDPAPSGSGSQPPAGSSVPGPSKGIGSLAKKQSDVTRLGSQKLKFTPTLPVRRKKETEVKQELAQTVVPPTAPTRGRGRGRGRGAGEGGRGGAPRPPPVEMTASGPFAMGPALAGSGAHRRVPRSNFTPIAPMGPGAASALGAGLSATAAPTLADKGKGKAREGAAAVPSGSSGVKKEEDEEVYSDPDEGVEIVDMEDVKMMDWMAPESLRKEREKKKKKKKIQAEVVKQEEAGARVDEMDVDAAVAAGEVDLANAVDLSESEEEEELEDLIDDFALQTDLTEEADLRQERLYFFQFPEPFPTFVSPSSATAPPPAPLREDEKGKKAVSFAEDTKPPAAAPAVGATPSDSTTTASTTPELSRLDGLIGHLEIYQSGAVRMRFGNGVLMDVTAATQPSFLQHAVHLDMPHKRLHVLGEVNKRFVVSPNVDALLADVERADEQGSGIDFGEDGLLRMDET